jgi:hypothetical protein
MNHSGLLALALLALALTGCATSSATSEGESNFQWVGRPYYGNQEPQQSYVRGITPKAGGGTRRFEAAS